MSEKHYNYVAKHENNIHIKKPVYSILYQNKIPIFGTTTYEPVSAGLTFDI